MERKKRKRTASDTCYRLCRAVGPRLYKLIKARNEVFRDENTLRWKLFVYYLNLEEPWSRKQEQADWAHHKNLASLKYETKRWLIQIVSKVGGYPNADLVDCLGEVYAALALGGDPDAMDILNDGMALAEGREQFDLLRALLGLERQVVEKCFGGAVRTRKLEKNLRRQARVDAQVAELTGLLMLRVKYYEPIKETNEADGQVEPAAVAAFEKSLSEVVPSGLSSKRALREFLAMGLALQSLIGNSPSAMENGKALLSVHDTCPWMREENWFRYFQELKSACFTACLVGERNEVYRMLRVFEESDFEDNSIRTLGMGIFIETQLHIGEKFDDVTLKRKAIDLLHATEVLPNTNNFTNQTIWLCYRAIKACIDLEEHNFALQLLQKIISAKFNGKSNLLLQARTLQTMCLLKTAADQEAVNEASISAAKFLRRQQGDQSFCLAVVNHVGKITRAMHDPELHKGRAVEAAKEISKLASTTSGKMALKRFPYADWFNRYAESVLIYCQ